MTVTLKPPASSLAQQMADSLTEEAIPQPNPSQTDSPPEGETETVTIPKVTAFSINDRMPEIGDAVFYWVKSDWPPFDLVRVPAQLHSQSPILDGHPDSGKWNLGVHIQAGRWMAVKAANYSETPKELHWTWE